MSLSAYWIPPFQYPHGGMMSTVFYLCIEAKKKHFFDNLHWVTFDDIDLILTSCDI